MPRIKLTDTTDLNADLGGTTISNGVFLRGRLGLAKDFGDGIRGSAGLNGQYVKAGDYSDASLAGGDATLEKEFKNRSKLRGKYSENPMEQRVGVEYEIPFSKGGKVATAARRADGIAQRGKTKGRIV